MLQSIRLYKNLLASIILIIGVHVCATAQMVINPGVPQTVCPDDSITLGGSPLVTGGTPPYVVGWAPIAGLNNPADWNPDWYATVTTTFTVTVVDFLGNRQTDSVIITVDNISLISAGSPATICPYLDSATIGSPSNPPADIYSWNPATGLNCPSCPTTIAKPNVTTTYTLTASDGTCTAHSTVTITVLPPPIVSTISPVTIDRGQSTTLNVTGLTGNYQWVPTNTLTNFNSPDPEASPSVTTTYTVFGTTASGCYGIDSVVVDVTNDSNLFFYNTFTPNGDGINDTWYIGNIDLFPNNEVIVFNRYGKEIYTANGYLNQWNGTVDGTNVPDATYYYIVYTGTGQSYKGSVTIIRKLQ